MQHKQITIHCKLFLNVLFLFLSVFAFEGCKSVYKSTIKDNGKQIPPEFGKVKTTILVIEKGRSTYDKYLEKNWEAYTGDYVIINRDQLNSKKYSDLTKYKYIFDYDSRTTNTVSNGNIQSNEGYTFYLQDRADNKKYSSYLDSGVWSKLMKAYISKIEEVRIKNEEGK